MWAAPCKNVSSGVCGQRRPGSAFASAQSDKDLHCPLIEWLDTVEHNKVWQSSWTDYISPLADLDLYCLHLPLEDTFSNVAAHVGCAMRNRVFGHMRTAKSQIRLRIRAVWSGPSQSANRDWTLQNICRMYQWRANARMILRMRGMNLNMRILCSETYFLTDDVAVHMIHNQQNAVEIFANNDCSDPPVHLWSLIRVVVVWLQNFWISKTVSTECKNPDQTVHVWWICAFHKCSKAVFHFTRPIYYQNVFFFMRNLMMMIIWCFTSLSTSF